MNLLNFGGWFYIVTMCDIHHRPNSRAVSPVCIALLAFFQQRIIQHSRSKVAGIKTLQNNHTLSRNGLLSHKIYFQSCIKSSCGQYSGQDPGQIDLYCFSNPWLFCLAWKGFVARNLFCYFYVYYILYIYFQPLIVSLNAITTGIIAHTTMYVKTINSTDETLCFTNPQLTSLCTD